MRVSCLPCSLFDEFICGRYSILDWARFGKKIGLDGIDISMLLIKNHYPLYMHEILDVVNNEIPIIMATTYPDFTNPDVMQRQRELDYLVRDIAVCSELGIPYIRVVDGQVYPEVNHHDGVMYAVEGLLSAEQAASRYGVKMLFENHYKPAVWERRDFSFPTDLFLKIVDGLRGSTIGINFDISNVTAYGDDPLDVLPKIIDMVETIHVSDTREIGVFNPVEVGEGVAPIKETLSYLKEYGFNGWLCIEEASGHGLDGIRRSVNNVKAILKEIDY